MTKKKMSNYIPTYIQWCKGCKKECVHVREVGRVTCLNCRHQENVKDRSNYHLVCFSPLGCLVTTNDQFDGCRYTCMVKVISSRVPVERIGGNKA